MEIYIDVPQAHFSLASVLEAAKIGKHPILCYGGNRLADSAVHEAMVGKKDYLRNHASEVTFGDTALTATSRKIHTNGAMPIYRAPYASLLEMSRFPIWAARR